MTQMEVSTIITNAVRVRVNTPLQRKISSYTQYYDFLPVFGEEHIAVFRRHAYCNNNYVEYRPAREYWGGPLFDVSSGIAGRGP